MLWINYLATQTRDSARVKTNNYKRWAELLELYHSRILDCASAKEVFLKVFSPEAVGKIQRLRTNNSLAVVKHGVTT